MTFKYSIKKSLLGLVILSTVSLVACDRFEHGNSTSKEVIRVPTEQFACLDDVPANAKSYFSDALSEDQTQQIFSCMDSSLTMFEKFGSGQNPNQFTSEELRQFVNRYMLSSVQISAPLMAQLMKAKTVLLGGPSSTMTRDDLKRAHQLFSFLSTNAVKLRGQWKILLFAADRKTTTDSQLAQANSLAQSSLADLINFSTAETSGYAWNDFKALFEEIKNFINMGEALSNLEKWMPLVDGARQLFLGNSINLSAKSGWLSTGQWTADVYYLVARMFYRLKDLQLGSAKAWFPIIDLVDMGIGLIDRSPQFQSQKILKAADLDTVVDGLDKLGLCPLNIPASVMKETYRHLFAIIKQGESLSGPGSFDWTRVEGFDSEMLDHVKLEYQIWKLTQKQIIGNFNDQESLPWQSLLDAWKPVDVSNFSPALQRSWVDWLSIVRSPYSLVFGDGGHLEIPSTPAYSSVNVLSLTILNSLRSFVRLVEMGYGEKPNPQSDVWDGMMSQAGVVDWEKDFLDLGQAIQFLDPRQSDAATRFYSDSRFFTFSSVGADKISSQQLLELISLMVSGGKVVGDQIMTYLAADNCLVDQKDLSFFKPMAEKKCFEQSFKLHFTELFANLPNMVSEVNNKHLDLDKLMPYLEEIAYDPTEPEGYVQYGNLRTLGGVLHYVESIMQVFDTNHNEMLSLSELEAAYPRFKSVVASISPMGKVLTEDAFLYVVYKGSMPKTTGFIGTVSASSDFALFVAKRQLGSGKGGLGSVSRLNLFKVIAILKQGKPSAK